jgi:ribosomal protein S18 acetylase RimI-like enzyme
MDTTLSSIPNSSALIQPATWRDLNTLRYLERVCFPKDAWPLWDLIGVLSLPNIVRLKAVDQQNMIGFIAADIRARENLAWIATIGVLPDYQGKGIGNALLQACEKHLNVPTVRLNVRVSNQPAIHLYHRLLYHEVGIWPGYYMDGENALVLEKRLD